MPICARTSICDIISRDKLLCYNTFMRKILFTLFACCAMWGHAQSNEYRTRGYKGNVELCASYDLVDLRRNGCGLLTTHGIQLNRLFFVGGGIGYETGMLPIYADFKSYFTKKELKVNPWAELKMGFDTINLGCYLSPSFGFTVPLANDYAFSVALASGIDPSYTVNVGMRVGFYF